MISITALSSLSNAVPWGLWVAIYIFLVGISCGALALIAAGNLQGSLHIKNITRLGLVLALSTLLAGLLSIQIDLGHIERFPKLFLSPNFAAVMAAMVWTYGAYFAILAISLLLLKRGIPKPFFVFSFVFALVVLVLESLLFARPPGKHWHSLIFLVHFLTSSLVSAIAALILSARIFWAKDKKPELLGGLSKIALPILAVNLIVEIIDLLSFGGFSHLGSWFLILGNLLAIVFLRRRTPLAITFAAGIGLIAAFFSKYHSLISAQLVEPFSGFARSYIEPRLMFIYSPNAFEVFVAMFLICLAAGLFYFLYKVLPLTREE